jgi:tetratricopeptide (TPR) repeat protein
MKAVAKLLAVALFLTVHSTVFAQASDGPGATGTSRRETRDSDRELARQHYDRGLEFAAAGDFQRALGEFLTAYNRSPNFAVLYNIGQVYIALERHDEALAALGRYLNDGASQVPRERVERIHQQLAALRAELARATPPASPEPPRPAVPLAPARPSPARADEPAGPLPSRTPGRPTEMNRTGRAVAYVLGGAGIALGGAAVVHYIWNRSRFERWETEDGALQAERVAGDYRTRQAANNELGSSIDRAQWGTLGLALSATACLGGGLALFALSSDAAPVNVTGSLSNGIHASLGGAF